jgi:riboflavin-specific deaminase-like protein
MVPFVYLNVATTADGKLAPANRHFVAFSSKRDQRLLLELRTKADAVMAGARTVDLVPVNLGPGPAKYRRMRLRNGLAEYNLRVVVSGSGTLNPRAEIFKRRFSPIIVLVCEQASERNVRRLRGVADEVAIFGKTELDFRAALNWLSRKWKVKRLLCEGGGEVNAGLFRAGQVDEIYQTICPLIFGGRNAPTMADGIGVQNLNQATRLQLKSLKRFGQELYLVYRVLKKPWV